VTAEVDAAVADAFREDWGRIVATLIRTFRDWDLAEDCAQDAFAQALKVWPRDGVPRRPGAWLTTVARNRALDRLRRKASEAAKLGEVAVLSPGNEPSIGDDDTADFADDRLQLIFACCHPALPLEGRVALTLRTLAGLTTAEIARAFLTPEATMAKRVVRAKHKIRAAGIPYRVPPAHLLPERVGGVLAVLYLLFTEGYAATSGADLMRSNLSAEAIHLTRVLVQLMPDEPEALALLALLLFHDARRDGRIDADGDLVTLEDQDRARWDRGQIEQADRLLQSALRRGGAGYYALQAAIAGCHATAPDAASTDWVEIAELYARLGQLVRSPFVALNRAVAVAMSDGPAAGLLMVDELEATGELAGYHLLPATRADLLRRGGHATGAAHSYREALDLAPTEAERRYLRRRLAELDGPANSGTATSSQ
jgi:RNA polymerase sigma-70 factor (ECF subfamily)